MSDVATTQVIETPAMKSRARLEKVGKLFLSTNAEMKILEELTDAKNPNYIGEFKDWTNKAPESFTNAAIVLTSDESEMRLVAIADKQSALSDPIVQDYLYERYVARVLNAAKDPDNYEALFVTIGGPLGAGGDNQAYRFQAKAWVEVLHRIGLKNAAARSLENALQSAANARATFPRFKEEDWSRLIAQMAANAEKHGYSTAWFAHVAATRDLEKDKGEAVQLPDDIAEQFKIAEDTLAAEATKGAKAA